VAVAAPPVDGAPQEPPVAVDLPPVDTTVHRRLSHPVSLGPVIIGGVKGGQFVPVDWAALAAVPGVDPQHSAPARFVELPSSLTWYAPGGDSGTFTAKGAVVGWGCAGSIELRLVLREPAPEGFEGMVVLESSLDALPRRFVQVPAQEPWRSALGRLLERSHRGQLPVELEWVRQGDLDGDGTVDTLLYARHVAWSAQCRGPGRELKGECSVGLESAFDAKETYSFLAVAMGGTQELSELAGWKDGPLLDFAAFAADANGDGAMELFVEATYYEGTDWSVLEAKEGGWHEVLTYGCGL